MGHETGFLLYRLFIWCEQLPRRYFPSSGKGKKFSWEKGGRQQTAVTKGSLRLTLNPLQKYARPTSSHLRLTAYLIFTTWLQSRKWIIVFRKIVFPSLPSEVSFIRPQYFYPPFWQKPDSVSPAKLTQSVTFLTSVGQVPGLKLSHIETRVHNRRD